jgi:hypothetical protein
MGMGTKEHVSRLKRTKKKTQDIKRLSRERREYKEW